MKTVMSSIMYCPKTTIAAFVAVFVLAAPLHARAEAKVCEGNGYRFEIGDGFEVQRKNDEICTYRSGEDAIIMLKDWPGLNRAMIENIVDHGFQTGSVALEKHGELHQLSTAGGTGYLANVAGSFQGRAIEGIAGGFVGEGGQGVAVLISSLSDKWSEYEKQANAVIESIEFTRVSPQAGARQWQQVLSGSGLSYRDVSENGDTQENYYFCSDGRFHSSTRHSEHAGGDGNTMYGFSNSRDSGEWDVLTVQGATQLVLYYNNGREKRANIEDRDGETWIDNTRYHVIENRRCR